jgi:hypothetical protein
MLKNVLDRNLKSDRIMVLKVKDGTKPKGSTGLTDGSLFTGGNNLHAKMDLRTCLWHLEYDNGSLPPAFKQQFTSFPKLFTFVTNYYANRNVEIVKVID